MMKQRIKQYLTFIEYIEKMKDVLRTAWTASGRRESDAEHSYRLALLAAVMLSEFPEADAFKVLVMCLVHDIGEIETGDISAVSLDDTVSKYNNEQIAMKSICKLLPQKEGNYIYELWEEYNAGQTFEARLVKALDKAETILQHSQGDNPKDFDYEFNLSYGTEYFETDIRLKELRNLLDQKTKDRILEDH